MKSYLSMIPIAAKQHRKQDRLTVACIVIAVFLVTAIFSMAEMAVRQETARLAQKHGMAEVLGLFGSEAFRSILPIALLLALFVLCAGVFMIAGSLNSSIGRRIRFFGMLRCIGMSRRQIRTYVRLEALNWCRIAIPAGLFFGTAAEWLLCAILKYGVGGEWAQMPQMKFSVLGISCGIVIGLLTVLIAASAPARRAAGVTPVSALSGRDQTARGGRTAANLKIETALGIRHAADSKKNLILMIGSFALSILLFFSFSVLLDLVDCLMPQSASRADLEVHAAEDEWIDASLLSELEQVQGVERVLARRAVFGQDASCETVPGIRSTDVISFGAFDLEALKADGILAKRCDLAPVVNGEAVLVISDAPVETGDAVTVFGRTLPIAGKLKYDPFASDGQANGTTLIVSDAAFSAMTGIRDYTLLLVQLSDRSDETAERIMALGKAYSWSDDRDADTRGTYLAFLVCVYGFLGVIALVTVLNVAGSISISVSSKLRQYGMMRAVGMSKKQIGRMIRAETLTYAVLGCGVGVAIALPLSAWLYGFLVTSHFPYAVWQLPWKGLLLILAFFVLSVCAGIAAPTRRMNGLSVTETIAEL